MISKDILLDGDECGELGDLEVHLEIFWLFELDEAEVDLLPGDPYERGGFLELSLHQLALLAVLL